MSKIKLPYKVYENKVEGCWLGKSVGGTLGGPNEGDEGPLALTFYDPVPHEMLPNDDLDLQVVWHEKIRTKGLPVNRRDLADAWLENIHLYPDEYGVATRNLTKKIYPPLSGSYDNKFTAGMGAAIRTELWACLAPGDPDLAVLLAREDACVDHAGAGVDAPVFLAAMESLAFVESNIEILLDRSLEYISEESPLYKAIGETREWYKEGKDWLTIRSLILNDYACQNWTDVVPNLCFIVMGLLMFEKEGFDKSLCTSVNCGLDTDCTGATLGALLGILKPDCIGERWLKLIGKKMVLSPGMTGMSHPDDLDQFSAEIGETAVNVLSYYNSSVELTEHYLNPKSLKRQLNDFTPLNQNKDTLPHSLLSLSPLITKLYYGESPVFLPNEEKTLSLVLTNPFDIDAFLLLDFSLPRAWSIKSEKGEILLKPGESQTLELKITSPNAKMVRTYLNMLIIGLSINGVPYKLTAGLVQSYPWICTRKNNKVPRENRNHFWVAPAGRQIYETEIKIPWKGFFMFVTQGLNRPIKTYLDGELINDYDGSFYVPAVHRNLTGTGKEVQRGWHNIRLEVEEGLESEIFFDVGVANNWSLLNNMEWRISNE